MEKLLPSEILIKIFLNLSVDDIQSVADTCVHWKNIIEFYNIWKAHWMQLVRVTSKTNLEDNLYLKYLKISDLDLKHSCTSLKNILYNKHNQIYNCLQDNQAKTFDFGLLRTHYSKVTLTLIKQKIQRNVNYVKNEIVPTSNSYTLFRSPPKLLEALDVVFRGRSGRHVHVRELIYMYPLGLTKHMPEIVSYLLGAHHVQELVLVPRVLALCEGLSVMDAVVVYSSARSTEVALICGGRVAEHRWVELPVGGWQVAQHLHAAFKWLHPDEPADPRRFEDPTIKKFCWLRMPNHAQHKKVRVIIKKDNQSLELKEEQYLATELMYCELDLCEEVAQLSAGLADEQLGRCLSHVLLAGGNCQLRHLGARLRLELAQRWPQHAATLSTSVHSLTYTPSTEPLMPTSAFAPGQTCRITRQLYLQAGAAGRELNT